MSVVRSFFAFFQCSFSSLIQRFRFQFFPLERINVAFLLLIRLFSLLCLVLKGRLHWTNERRCLTYTHSLSLALSLSIYVLLGFCVCALISCFLLIPPFARAFIYINLFVVYLIFNEFQSARVHVHILFGAKTEQRRTRVQLQNGGKNMQVIWVYGLVFAMKQIYGYFLFCVCNKNRWLLNVWRVCVNEQGNNGAGETERDRDRAMYACECVSASVTVCRLAVCLHVYFYLFAFISYKRFFLWCFSVRFMHWVVVVVVAAVTVTTAPYRSLFCLRRPMSKKDKYKTKWKKKKSELAQKRALPTITTTMENDTTAKKRKRNGLW